MTTFAVISDIHGNPNNLELAIKTARNKQADWFLLLGDLLNHGPRNGLPHPYDPMKISTIINEIAPQTIAVKGNCDSEVDEMLITIPINSYSNILPINRRKCFLTHGHRFKPEQAANLGLKAGDIFISGHTHQRILQINDAGIIILNPGSITFPKPADNDIPLEKSMAFIDEQEICITDLCGNVLKSLQL